MRALLLAFVSVGALLPAQDPARPLVVGFAQIGADNPWRAAETESIRQEAKARGIELKFADGQDKQENQIRALRTFVVQKVDAILLAPKTGAGWEPVLKEIKAAGIPVLLVDRGVTVSDPSLYATLVASDFVAEGRMAGEWLAQRLSGKGKVVELRGTTGSDPAIERKKGFAAAIAKHPGIEVVKSQDGDFKRGKAKEVMEAFLKALGKEIAAVYAHNDDMAIGAIQAIEEAGLAPGKDILVVSIDGMRFAFEAMRDGKLNATVECSPLLGPKTFDALAQVLAHKPVPKKVVVEDRLFEQAQAAAELPRRKY